jgi:hypothetical protein
MTDGTLLLDGKFANGVFIGAKYFSWLPFNAKYESKM